MNEPLLQDIDTGGGDAAARGGPGVRLPCAARSLNLVRNRHLCAIFPRVKINIVVSMNDENPQSTAAATPGTAAAPLPLNKNKATRRRM